jgi:hypothetical protein
MTVAFSEQPCQPEKDDRTAIVQGLRKELDAKVDETETAKSQLECKSKQIALANKRIADLETDRTLLTKSMIFKSTALATAQRTISEMKLGGMSVPTITNAMTTCEVNED